MVAGETCGLAPARAYFSWRDMAICAVTPLGKTQFGALAVLVGGDGVGAGSARRWLWPPSSALPSTTKSRSRIRKPASMSRMAPPVRKRLTFGLSRGRLDFFHHPVLVRAQVALQHVDVVAHRNALSTFRNFPSGPGRTRSGPGVVFLYGFPKSRPHDMGINLGGRDIGMAQHDLHTAQVGSAFQQMSGKAVTKHVGRKPVENARFPAVAGEQLPERLTGEATAARSNEKVAAGASLEQSGAARCRDTPRPPGQRLCPPAPDAVCCPCPVVRTMPRSRLQSPSPSRHNSDTRRPVAYSNSSMARSRRPVGRVTSAA